MEDYGPQSAAKRGIFCQGVLRRSPPRERCRQEVRRFVRVQTPRPGLAVRRAQQAIVVRSGLEWALYREGGFMYDFDLFVIGAGSGGVRTARMAARDGVRVGIA